MSRNAPMMPQTVPKRPTNGAAAAVVPRKGTVFSSVVSSALAAPERLEEALALPARAPEVQGLADDDGPARDRREDEDEEHRGHGGTAVGDELQIIEAGV